MKHLKLKSSYKNIVKKKKIIKNEIHYNLTKSIFQNSSLNKIVRTISILKHSKNRYILKKSRIEKTCLLTGRFNSVDSNYKMARHQFKYYTLLGRMHNLKGQSW